MSEMIDFITALQYASRKLTDEEMTADGVADVLWLEHAMSSSSQEPTVQLLQLVDESSVITDMEQVIQKPQQDSQAKTISEVFSYSPDSQTPLEKTQSERKETHGGIVTRMPDAPALQNTLPLERALRPLKRRYPSRKTLVLNVSATVHQIAETKKRTLVPVMEPALERWFELALVIDEGASMNLWHETTLELRTFFERLGAFFDIRVWSLATNNETSVQLYAETASPTHQRVEHKPEELLDPTGRRLILVVTDCVSPAWYSGAAQNVLEVWGQKNLVTLLQMLPWRLWTSTALSISENVYISNAVPGTANVKLKIPEFQEPSFSDNDDTDILSMPFPVITLSEDSLKAWARMVMGTESVKVAGVMFAKEALTLQSRSEVKSFNVDAKEGVRHFFAAASPEAFRLAQLLSTTSVTLPVIRIIQQSLFPESEQKPEYIAEMFLGDLLKETHRDHANTRIYSEYVKYEFHPNVKKILKDSLSLADESRVHKTVSKYYEDHLGITRNFLGVVVAPSSLAELTVHEADQHIAEILISEWRELGDDNASLADLLEEQVDKGKIPVSLQEQLRQARAEVDRETRAINLLALLPQLNGQRIEVMHEALAIMQGIACSKNYISALLACLPYVPEEYKVEVIVEVLESARLVTHEKERIEALDELHRGLPEAWKAEAIQQALAMTRNMTDTALRTSTLRTLRTAAPKSLTHVINREMEANRKTRPAQTANKDLPSKKFRSKPSHTEFVCPSCFHKNFTGDCRILSGIGEHKVLKAAPTSPRQKEQARKNPEPVDTPFYVRELACRECTSCGYLVPREIEQFPSLALAIVGDTFSGKSHYITTLLHQLREEWINDTQSFMRLRCLTPDVETNFLRSYEQLFVENLALGPTTPTVDIPMEGKATKPLIYNLSIGSSLQESSTTINLMLYDIAGEDFQRERLVQVAPFALGADAFIFVADPITMHPVLERLPASMQKNIRNTIQRLGSSLTDIRQQPDSLNDTLTLYNNFHKQRKTMSLPDTPVAVMVSKADLIRYIPQAKCYSFTVNPRYSGSVDLQDMANVDKEVKEFLREYRQGPLLATTRILQHVQFFATSATGGPPDEQGRFKHVEPRRCLDPILWILHQLGIIIASM